MKKFLIPLFCLILIHCKKNEAQSLNASLVDVIQEDKVAAADAPPPPSAVAEEMPNSVSIHKNLLHR